MTWSLVRDVTLGLLVVGLVAVVRVLWNVAQRVARLEGEKRRDV